MSGAIHAEIDAADNPSGTLEGRISLERYGRAPPMNLRKNAYLNAAKKSDANASAKFKNIGSYDVLAA